MAEKKRKSQVTTTTISARTDTVIPQGRLHRQAVCFAEQLRRERERERARESERAGERESERARERESERARERESESESDSERASARAEQHGQFADQSTDFQTESRCSDLRIGRRGSFLSGFDGKLCSLLVSVF